MHDAEETSALALPPLDKLHHRFPAPLDNACIAVGFINRPGTYYPRIAPRRPKVPPMLKRKRRVTGKSAAGPLRFHKLPQPLGIKGCNVGVIGGRADVKLSIPRPAKPLIALRTIAGQIEE